MTFFSGTDTATLKEEGMDRNHFVSLIVNNEGTYTAGITRKVVSTKTITEEYSYATFEDREVKNTKSYNVEVEELEWFNLSIEFENSKNSFQEILKNRLEEIKKAKAEKAKLTKVSTVYKNQTWNGYPKESKESKSIYPFNSIGSNQYKGVSQSYVSSVGPANRLAKAEEDELPFNNTPANSESVNYVDNDAPIP